MKLKHRLCLILSALSASAAFAAETPPPRIPLDDQLSVRDGRGGWEPLFNGKDLSNWDIFIRGEADNADSKGYFTVHDGMIHTYKDVPETERVSYGVFQTRESYSRYRLRFEYQWGKKKFAPRKELPRDAGLLFHCFQPDRQYWSPGGFPPSAECQVQENDAGDLWLVTTQGRIPLHPKPQKERPLYLPEAEGGVWTTQTTGRVHRGSVSDTLEGWNKVEVEVLGDRARYWVNGKQVMEVSDLKKPAKPGAKNFVPLTEGKIAFQCEAAEVFYRKIEIMELPKDAQPGPAPAAGPSAEAAVSAAPAGMKRPNIVFIMTDNQGAWTLGCHGNPDIRTPHIDRLAAEGLRFTRALSSNPVCSPTRATFLTGLIPSQHGVHSFLDPKYMMGPQAYNTLGEFTSLAEVLRDAGYVCGLSGKWHLGDHLKPSEGFSFWITKPGGHTHEFYDQDIIEEGKVRKEEGYTTDLWTRKGIEFIEQNKARPFFLLLAYNGPYVLGNLMLNPSKNRHAEYYRGKHFNSFPVDAMHPWQNLNKPFHNQQVAMERTACEVSGVDDGVGDVMAALKRLGLDDNTLVIFASDQGWMGGQNGMWGMGDHFKPTGAHELMMQIPLIFRQPGKIPAGSTNDFIVSNYDFLPSVLSHLGLGDKMPQQPKSPGRDFSAALRGEKLPWENVMFYEMETTRAVRTDDWKYVARFPNGPFELYDMKRDPRERFNLYGQPGTDAKRDELAKRLEDFFARHADPQYDIWKGGRSKARRQTE